MIKINKKSWHYQLVDFGTDSHYNISNNLCTYFWQLVKGFLFGVLALVFVTVVIGTVIFALSAPFMSLLPGESIFAAALCGIYGALIMKVAGETVSRDHWLGTDVFAKLKKEKKERKPSIIKEYLKAKKQKICPTLTFE